jgi:hypothetical protein
LQIHLPFHRLIRHYPRGGQKTDDQTGKTKQNIFYHGWLSSHV